ncbi:hypothetical protein HOS47_gp02 [Pseudomonas phage uligo]|uniref:Uncharacterized protein n=1 Tax=Pseudomonas phage uligo TaxID=2048979 RepID=A0A2H4P7Q8_9CAUD|nr:hypothetical protein HOS47_gp02 [Pseudomonas phage uligo]ATW58207.1 hypothetical protein [Pseudomonas phage uligo]
MRSYSVNKHHDDTDTGSMWGDAAFILLMLVGTFATLAWFVS